MFLDTVVDCGEQLLCESGAVFVLAGHQCVSGCVRWTSVCRACRPNNHRNSDQQFRS